MIVDLVKPGLSLRKRRPIEIEGIIKSQGPTCLQPEHAVVLFVLPNARKHLGAPMEKNVKQLAIFRQTVLNKKAGSASYDTFGKPINERPQT